MSDLSLKKDADASVDNTTASETAPAELAAVVDELLNQLTTKFSSISSELVAKMDEMSRRLDNLETTIQANAPKAENEDTK